MTNNDVLRSLRYALNISDAAVAKTIGLAGPEVGTAEIICLMKKEDEEGYMPCSNALLSAFLDGLIIQRRGQRDNAPQQSQDVSTQIDNNLILKKIRIAFELREEDILQIMENAGFRISKAEIGALFRKPEHKNYRPCKEQFLRNFLKGLSTRLRS